MSDICHIDTKYTKAAISNAIQFPVKGDTVWIKIIEAVSWIVIGLTGILALKQMGGFSLKNATATHSGLSRNWQFTATNLKRDTFCHFGFMEISQSNEI